MQLYFKEIFHDHSFCSPKKSRRPVIPVNRRVWQWCKDLKRKVTANDVAAGLNIPANNASSTLGQLCDRNMMIRTREFSKPLGKTISFYITSPSMKKYELLPISAEAKARPKRGQAKKELPLLNPSLTLHSAGPAKPEAQAPAAEPITSAMATEPAEKLSILDTMNVREAYATYLELQKMFNPQAPVSAPITNQH